jgi:hypothetical protein
MGLCGSKSYDWSCVNGLKCFWFHICQKLEVEYIVDMIQEERH